MISDWLNPTTVALIVAAPTVLLGYLGYRRSQRVDKIAEQAGIATTSQGSIQQVIDGLNSLIGRLETRLTAVEQAEEECKHQLAELNERFLLLTAKEA